MEKEKVIMVVSPFEELERGVHVENISLFNLIQDIDDEVYIVFNLDTKKYYLHMPNSYWFEESKSICLEEENIDELIRKTYNSLTTKKICVEIEKKMIFAFDVFSHSFLMIEEEECGINEKKRPSYLDFRQALPEPVINQNFAYARHFLFEGRIVHVFKSTTEENRSDYLVFQNYEPILERHFIHNVMNELMVLQIRDQYFS